MAKRQNKYAGLKNKVISYELGGIQCETVFSNQPKLNTVWYQEKFGISYEEDLFRVDARNKYNDELLFQHRSGVILGLKNGNCFIDAPLQIPIAENTFKSFSCYPLYVNKENICVDKDNSYIDGKSIFILVEELRKNNGLLRIDSSITSGYCSGPAMEKLIIQLNTRGSYLDVW